MFKAAEWQALGDLIRMTEARVAARQSVVTGVSTFSLLMLAPKKKTGKLRYDSRTKRS